MFIFSHISSSLTFFYVCRTSNETVHEQTHALRAPRDIQLSTGKFEHFFSRIFYLKLCGFSFFFSIDDGTNDLLLQHFDLYDDDVTE